MDYDPSTGTSALSPLAALFGGGSATSSGTPPGGGNPLAGMITALLRGSQGGQPPAPPSSPDATGTFEGNIRSPANPYSPSTDSFGMQPHRQIGPPPTPPSAPPPPAPPTGPFAGGAPPVPFMTPGSALSGPQPMPPNPFTQGTSPTPFLNTGALFGRPPIGGSPLSAIAQRPNPISSMQL